VPEYQRRGIGAYLIGLLETIGKATLMEKVMLTVFKGNPLKCPSKKVYCLDIERARERTGGWVR